MAKHFISRAWLAAMCAIVVACTHGAQGDISDFNIKLYEPSWAQGFEILGAPERLSSLIVAKSPWQGADSAASASLFIARGGEEPPAGYSGPVLRGDARRIVCMASGYVAMIDALGQTGRIVGVSGIDFISNPQIQARRAEVADVGYDGNIDYESLLAAAPDLVLLYGVNGASGMEPKLRELGIPYLYIGEYLEDAPLGKAEWLLPIAEAMGLREQADSAFRLIPEKYEHYRQIAAQVQERPAAMVNTPYRDSWVMPSSQSYLATLVRDAGGRMAYDKDTGRQSMAIDMEQAYALASQAAVWLNPGQASTLKEFKQAYPKFADVPAVANGQVWNCTLRQAPGGGNDYWESGVMRPDLVLRDLVKIFHPQLLEDVPFTYYQPLP